MALYKQFKDKYALSLQKKAPVLTVPKEEIDAMEDVVMPKSTKPTRFASLMANYETNQKRKTDNTDYQDVS